MRNIPPNTALLEEEKQFIHKTLTELEGNIRYILDQDPESKFILNTAIEVAKIAEIIEDLWKIDDICGLLHNRVSKFQSQVYSSETRLN